MDVRRLLKLSQQQHPEMQLNTPARTFSITGLKSRVLKFNFKINSRPLSTIIFKLKNDNIKTQDFSPLIERVLAGVGTFDCFPLAACLYVPRQTRSF